MQKLGVGLLLMIVMASCGGNGKSGNASAGSGDSSYVLSGTIEGVDSGAVILFNVQKGEENEPDTAKIIKGHFELKGFAAEPELAFLALVQEQGPRQPPLPLYLEAGKITVQAPKDSLYTGKVTGAASQKDLDKFNALVKPLEEKQKALYQQYQEVAPTGDAAKMGEIQKAYEALQDENKALVTKFVKENPSSYVAAFQLAQVFAYAEEVVPTELEPLYNGLDEKIKGSHFGKVVKDALDKAKSTAIGGVAPNFTLNDVNGKPVSLASFKGKYTLLDFWASWCQPCRMENPTVVKAYDTYKSKGFDILSVSLDDKKENWEKAIAQDKLAWTHVSDLKGWKSEAAALYGVKAIPMNYLLDKDGKIIAKSLRGEDLIKKLGEVLN
jgi:peroxiredoxin